MIYQTYQAAKIANPESDIYHHPKGHFFPFEPRCYEALVSQKCNPADYCMTVKQFLDAGHKFVEGDVYLCAEVGVFTIPEEKVIANNTAYDDDDMSYILKAKALEEAKPEVNMSKITEFRFGDVSIDFSEDERVIVQDDGVKLDVKTEIFKQICIQYLCLECPDVINFDGEQETKTYRYEKVTFEKASEAIAAWEDGELFTKVNQNDYAKIADAKSVLTYLYRLYRRIEVTERELFINTQEEMAHKDGYHINRLFLGWQFDNGVRLVNGKG